MFLVPSCAILFWMSCRSCSVTRNSMRIGRTRCGSVLCVQPLDIRLLKLQRTIFCGLGGTLEKISPFIFQRTVSGKNLVPAQKKFLSHFTTDIFSEKNRGLPEKSENKMLPALEKAEASCSADMRFERTASTAAVRTQRRNERSGLSASLLIGSCWEHPNPY